MRLRFASVYMLIGTLIVVAFGASACKEFIQAPPDALAYAPPPYYRLWWSATEMCSARNGAFDDVRWAIVPATSRIVIDHADTVAAEYFPEHNEIVLAARDTIDGALVRHEMLHALLRTPGHPSEYFYTKCGGYVTCVGACVREAGIDSSRLAYAVDIDRGALDLNVSVYPETTSVSRDGGRYVFAVAIHNTLNTNVRARLAPLAGNAAASSTFGYGASGGSPSQSYSYVLGDSVELRAGQTERQVFDAEVFRPGTYSITGYFNSDSASTVRLVVVP